VNGMGDPGHKGGSPIFGVDSSDQDDYGDLFSVDPADEICPSERVSFKGTWKIYQIFPWLPCHHFWLRCIPKANGWVCERCGQTRPQSFKPKPRRAWSGT
jgi:hypothetical protein